MTVWIVVSILLVVLSPLAWLRPSRQQSGRMACRMRARSLGLGMQLAPQQWPHWMPAGLPSTAAEYHRPCLDAEGPAWEWWQPAPGHWVNRWQEPCEDPELLARLVQLPGDVWALRAERRMVCAVWGERSGTEQVALVDRILRELSA